MDCNHYSVPGIFKQELGAEWKKLNDDEKKPFQTEFEQKKAEYAVLFEEYSKSKPYQKYLAELAQVMGYTALHTLSFTLSLYLPVCV